MRLKYHDRIGKIRYQFEICNIEITICIHVPAFAINTPLHERNLPNISKIYMRFARQFFFLHVDLRRGENKKNKKNYTIGPTWFCLITVNYCKVSADWLNMVKKVRDVGAEQQAKLLRKDESEIFSRINILILFVLTLNTDQIPHFKLRVLIHNALRTL